MDWVKRILWIPSTTEWMWSLYNLLKAAGVIGMIVLPAWATWATNTFSEYAPFSWVAAGFAGYLIASVSRYIFASASQIGIRNQLEVKFLNTEGFVNPLESTFNKKRVFVTQICPPIGGIIEGKTFVDCEVVGPANVIFDSNCTFQRSSGGPVDGFILKSNARPNNGIAFTNCTFKDCGFYAMTIMIPKEMETNFMAWGWTGINWLSENHDSAEIEDQTKSKKKNNAK